MTKPTFDHAPHKIVKLIVVVMCELFSCSCLYWRVKIIDLVIVNWLWRYIDRAIDLLLHDVVDQVGVLLHPCTVANDEVVEVFSH